MPSQLMGILNVTEDSFFAESRASSLDHALDKAEEMIEAGANWIDIGGESSRPGAQPVSEAVELERVVPVIQALAPHCPIPISIDTYKPAVARAAIQAGAAMINDITGFTNPAMRLAAKETGAKLCVMHMQGKPQTMQLNPDYPNGVTEEVSSWLKGQAELLVKEGINPKAIFLDPGIGFGKTTEDCFTLIRDVEKLQTLGFPLLIGLSRKTFLYKSFKTTPENVLPATLTLHTFLAKRGVEILRVHDVAAHRQLLTTLTLLKEKNASAAECCSTD